MYWRNVTAWLQIERENTDGSSMGVSTIFILTRSLFRYSTK